VEIKKKETNKGVSQSQKSPSDASKQLATPSKPQSKSKGTKDSTLEIPSKSKNTPQTNAKKEDSIDFAEFPQPVNVEKKTVNFYRCCCLRHHHLHYLHSLLHLKMSKVPAKQVK